MCAVYYYTFFGFAVSYYEKEEVDVRNEEKV